MDNGLLILILQVAILVGTYIYNRFIANNPAATSTIADATAQIDFIIKQADAFVSWAKQFMSKNTGSEKMAAVVDKLIELAQSKGIEMDKQLIQAIVQKSYDNMKAAEVANTTPSTVINVESVKTND